MPYTEKQKAEMLRLKDVEGLSHAEIGDRFGVAGTKRERGDKIRKVLERYRQASAKAAPAQKRVVVKAKPETKAKIVEPAATGDRLARLHDEFDTKVPGRLSSRPKWAGPRPLRIMPKNFQKAYYNPEPEEETAGEKVE